MNINSCVHMYINSINDKQTKTEAEASQNVLESKIELNTPTRSL